MYKKLVREASKHNINEMEVTIINNEKLEIEMFNEDIDKYEVSKLCTYSIKAKYNGKVVKIYTEDITNIKDIIKEIILVSTYIEIDEDIKLATTKDKIRNKNKYVLDSDTNDLIIKLRSLNELKKSYPQLKDINVGFEEVIMQKKMQNTSGVLLEDAIKRYSFGIEAIAKNGDASSSSFKNRTSVLNDIDMVAITKSTIEKAVDKLESNDFEAGIYNVIFESSVASSILSSFVSLFMAEKINNKTSILEGKLGTKVFGDNITIVEDPTNEKLPGKSLFDGEGTPTYYKEVIKNGVFETILYDNKNAARDKRLSTGNSYGVRNMYLVAGDKSLEDMISNEEKAILIDMVSGMHSGINVTNGDISLQAKGYLIEKGKKKSALCQFILGTNITHLMNNVIEVGNDNEFNSSIFNSPSILVKDIKVQK